MRTFVRVRAGGLPGAFWVLWGGTLVNRLGSMVNPFLSLYLTGIRGVPIGTTGLILAAVGVGSVISQPLGGFIADRFGRRVALSGGMLANGATLLTLGHAHSLGVLVPACFVLGITIDFFRPAALRSSRTPSPPPTGPVPSACCCGRSISGSRWRWCWAATSRPTATS